jgi:transcriptional regulator with XRE-family HTH domain
MKKEQEKENAKVDGVRQKITTLRSKKGYTFENMADELNITPSAYSKIEAGKTKLSMSRLFDIAEIFKEPISNFLGTEGNVFNQTNNENATGSSQIQYQQQIENFYQENKEVYEKLIAAKDEKIEFLKQLLEKK